MCLSFETYFSSTNFQKIKDRLCAPFVCFLFSSLFLFSLLIIYLFFLPLFFFSSFLFLKHPVLGFWFFFQFSKFDDIIKNHANTNNQHQEIIKYICIAFFLFFFYILNEMRVWTKSLCLLLEYENVRSVFIK